MTSVFFAIGPGLDPPTNLKTVHAIHSQVECHLVGMPQSHDFPRSIALGCPTNFKIRIYSPYLLAQ